MDEENTIKTIRNCEHTWRCEWHTGATIQFNKWQPNIRIQGLDGRYNQVLKDGMPLYDGFSAGFAYLVFRQLDLKQSL